MRILFMHHFPLGASEPGRWVERWATVLAAAGHEVRALVVDDGTQTAEPFVVERVVCREGDPAADLPFDLPAFSTPQFARGRFEFGRLTDRQLASYRDCLRLRLDAEIDRFNPQVIHAQHIWVQGQLALETGVPYVLNAWGPELIDGRRDARFGDLANQAAENAGRILVADPVPMANVVTAFDTVADRALPLGVELPATGPIDPAAGCRRLVELYQAVLVERFGRIP